MASFSLLFIQRRFITKEKKTIIGQAKQIFGANDKSGYTLHSHIVQIGDPILRQPTQKVEKSAINSESVQQTIKTLKQVINKYDAVGLSAPQIGVPMKIICVQMTRKQLDAWDPQTVKARGMEAFRQRILINPESKVIGNVQLFDQFYKPNLLTRKILKKFVKLCLHSSYVLRTPFVLTNLTN